MVYDECVPMKNVADTTVAVEASSITVAPSRTREARVDPLLLTRKKVNRDIAGGFNTPLHLVTTADAFG
jgi:hypothetical protein